MSWLKNANGWKRLWFVLTVIGLIWAVSIAPLTSSIVKNTPPFNKNPTLDKDYLNPQCIPYITKPIEGLTEPEDIHKDGHFVSLSEYEKWQETSNCRVIYSIRKEYGSANIPFVLESYYKEKHKEHLRIYWINYSIPAFFSLIIVLFFSFSVYMAGLIIAWIAAGFTAGKKP